MSKRFTAPICRLVLVAVLSVVTPAFATPPDTAGGATTYKSKCVACHGADGAGTSAGRSLNVADLRSPKVQNQTNAQLQQIVKNGINNMPAFADTLSDQEIAGVVVYLRTLGKKAAGKAGR